MGKFKPDPTDPVANARGWTRRQRRAKEIERLRQQITDDQKMANSIIKEHQQRIEELGRSLDDAQGCNRHLLDKLKEADWLKKNDQLTEELRVKTVDTTLLQQRIEDLEAKIAEFVDGENRGEDG